MVCELSQVEQLKESLRNMWPKISIVLPVYNVQSFIQKCITSILEQEYDGELECIIVDDCGNDKSMAIIDEILKTYHGPIDVKILHHEQNRGLSAARNTGTKIITGEYLLYIDSDDRLLPGAIENLARPLQEKKTDIVIAPYLTSEGVLHTPKISVGEHYGEEVLNSYLDFQWPVMVWNKLFNTNTILKSGFTFPEGYIFEDNLWMLQVASVCASITIIDTPTYSYTIRAGSLSRTDDLAFINYHMSRLLSEIERYCMSNPALWDRLDVHRHLYCFKSEYMRLLENGEYTYEMWKTLFHSCHPHLLLLWKHGTISTIRLIRELGYYLPNFIAYYYWQISCKMANSRATTTKRRYSHNRTN